MSSVVAETSSQLSASQSARTKQGQGNQASGGDGFSGLVDENLAASNEAAPAERPRAPVRDAAGSDPQPNRHTGIHAKSRNQAEPTRRSSSDAAANDARASDEPTPETAAIVAEAPIRTGVVTAEVVTESIDTTEQTDTEETPAPSLAPASGTTIVAAAVAVQIELAGEAPAPVIDSSDAITISNPPATIVPAPAETAAAALARVANDTGETQTGAVAETDIPASTETDAQTSTASAETAPAATPNVSTTDVAAEADPSIETSVSVETAAGDAQLAAKATTELSAAAKTVDPEKPVEAPKADQIIASTAPKPALTRDDEVRAAPEQTQAKADSSRTTDRHVEAKDAAEPRPDKPAVPERPTRQATQETPPANSSHTPASPSENAQPSGFGVTQVAPLHVPSFAASAALTAVAATSVTVPINGLAVEIAANVQIGRSRFEIRLDPPELGRIDVRLDVDKQGQVTSHLIVEKSATLDLLRRDAQQLERALQDAGLKTSDNGLQFSLRDQQQNGRNDDNGPGRNAQRLVVTEEETIAAETAGRSYGRMIGQRGGIDIRV